MKKFEPFNVKYTMFSEDPWGMSRISQKIRNENYKSDLANFIGCKKFDQAIDLACGDGTLTCLLHNFFSRIDLCDAYYEMLCKVKKRKDIKYDLVVLNKLPFISKKLKKKYDFIIAIEVLMYLEEEEILIFINEVQSIMNKNTLLIVTAPKEYIKLLEKGFCILATFDRFIEPFRITDFFYKTEKLLIKIQKKWHLSKSLLKPFLIICRKIYCSASIGYFLFNIGKKMGIKAKSKMLVLRLR